MTQLVHDFDSCSYFYGHFPRLQPTPRSFPPVVRWWQDRLEEASLALRQLSAAAELLQLETSEAFPRGAASATEAPEYQRRCQRAEGELQELRLGKCGGFFEFSCCFFFLVVFFIFFAGWLEFFLVWYIFFCSQKIGIFQWERGWKTWPWIIEHAWQGC